MNAKAHLHDRVQEALRDYPTFPDGGVVTRWVMVAEVAVPSGHGRLVDIKTSDAAGNPLASWDVRGLLGEAQAGLLSPPSVPPGQDPLPGPDDLPF